MNYLVKELLSHRWRTIAGISGYAIAVIFILLVMSVNLTSERDSVGILKTTGTHFILYIPSSNSCCPPSDRNLSEGSLTAEGGYTMMLNNDLIYSVSEIQGVRDAAPYLLYKIFDSNYKCNISLGGIDTGSIATMSNVCAATNLIEGRYLSGNRDEVVAEESFAMAHKLSVGDTLKTYGGRLVVGGIVNSGIKPGKADLYAPIEHVRTILRDSLKCISTGFDMNIIVVEVADARMQNRVIRELKEKMNYLSVSSYNCYKPASEVMAVMEGTSSALSIVIFLFLIIFSAKTQITSLMERIREIGILKSLGWSDSRLSIQILSISLIQSFLGASLGIIFGLGIIYLLNHYQIRIFSSLVFYFQPDKLPLLLFLSLAGGLMAGIYPIIKLYRTKAGDMINNFI